MRWTTENRSRVADMLREGMSAGMIAIRLEQPRSAVCGIVRRDEELKAIGFKREKGQKFVNVTTWTNEAKERVGELLKAGKTAREISLEFGVSRNSIASLVSRDDALAAIGFARQGTSFNGGRKSKLSQEERRERRRQYMKQYHSENPRTVAKPKLRVVSNNVQLMVEDWLKANGGARRFQRGESADPLAVQAWLRERGVDCNGVSRTCGAAYKVSRGSGAAKRMSWADVLAMVDKMRRAEGLQPFVAR